MFRALSSNTAEKLGRFAYLHAYPAILLQYTVDSCSSLPLSFQLRAGMVDTALSHLLCASWDGGSTEGRIWPQCRNRHTSVWQVVFISSSWSSCMSSFSSSPHNRHSSGLFNFCTHNCPFCSTIVFCHHVCRAFLRDLERYFPGSQWPRRSNEPLSLPSEGFPLLLAPAPSFLAVVLV